MEETLRLRLPLLVAGQGQKEITHNEALLLLDAAIGASVERRDVLVPPDDAQEGQCWLVPAGASLGWDGQADKLALWTAGGWRFLHVPEGFTVYVRQEQLRICRLGSGWLPEAPIGAPAAPITLPVGGGVVDAEVRAALAQVMQRLVGLGLIQP